MAAIAEELVIPQNTAVAGVSPCALSKCKKRKWAPLIYHQELTIKGGFLPAGQGASVESRIVRDKLGAKCYFVKVNKVQKWICKLVTGEPSFRNGWAKRSYGMNIVALMIRDSLSWSEASALLGEMREGKNVSTNSAVADDDDDPMNDAGIAPLPSSLRVGFEARAMAVLGDATLIIPETTFAHSGGRSGKRHSEHLGHLLTQMQWLQRAYPGATW